MPQRTLFRSALALVLGLAAAVLQAGSFSGTIHYRLSDAKGDVHELSLALSGTKVRSEAQAGGHAVASIIDLDAKTLTTLFAERHAYSVSQFKGALDQGKAAVSAVKTGATEVIAGYKAEEWTLTRDGKQSSVWLTEQLGRGFFSQGAPGGMDLPEAWKGKDYLLLRSSRPGGFKMEAVKVDTAAPAAALFRVPDDYTEVKNPFAAGAPGAMPADAARVQKAMEGLSPEQRAAMQRFLQDQGAPGH